MAYKLKIVMLGDFAVGKTSLVNRFVQNIFDENYLATLGVRISKKDVEVPGAGGKTAVSLILWDLNGADGFHSVLPQYLKGASGAILVGDLTRRDSLGSIARHASMYRRENPKGVILVALNKTDLLGETEIRKLEKSGAVGAEFGSAETFWTSAKAETNVQALFEAMASRCVAPDPR